MTIVISESMWLNDSELCSIERLAELSGLSQDEIQDLIDCGVITPVDTQLQSYSIQQRYIATAITARRLRDDFLLDRHGLTLALALLQRIDALEAELQQLPLSSLARHQLD